MLWYKNWLETRWVFVFVVAVLMVPLPLIAQHIGDSLAEADSVMQQTGLYWVFAAVLLAGAGVRTRSGVRNKGVNGSMYYLLSMPASRASLFVSRAGLGFLELAGTITIFCAANWLFVPIIRANADASEMIQYGLVVLACASGFYFLAVLGSSVIDDEMGKTWGSLVGGALVLWIARKAGMPASFDVLSVLSKSSPLHVSVPWNAMTLSVIASIMFALGGLVAVRRRDFSA